MAPATAAATPVEDLCFVVCCQHHMAVEGTRGLELQQPAAAQAAVVITHVPLLLTEKR
jgi:hypothetical protein